VIDAADIAWMEDLLVELVAASSEEAGQGVMARAFADCGLTPVDVPMDAAAIRADPHHSPFSWDVSGKRNVVATWNGRGGRSLILNGHVDVVPPASSR
jgi:acetylornithine deacetylase